ncbi:hypothetical protein Ait01nite_048100 [Actinoplanes italicus]|uniref:Tetratricopeptide repeat protein n=1 Tax=Actinoplanes italicus TaxID=113567 RepID=A0A2T0K9T9_9ACTN|nr:tetratricopeptide repeat protein [Actinoplanes italicus]PRX19912.1 tetratricopeptide repeat protein [Actinoplanes italicus]GIE31765.1 hypothetical protein Ait01nite_048100 [Actinoplanes italicus]
MSIKGDLAMARVMSHCGGSPAAGLRFAAGAVVRDPGSLEPYQLLAEIREQYPDTGADRVGLAGLLTDAYLARLAGDMDAAATALAWVTGYRPDVPWADAPWFDDDLVAGLSPTGMGDAAIAVADAGQPLDGEKLTPWFRAIEAVCAREPVPEQMARMAIMLRFAGRIDESFALCDRADAIEPLMITSVVRGATHRHLGDGTATRRCYERALELDPGNWSLYLDLADLAAAEDDFTGAAQLTARGLEHEPDEPALRAAAAAYRARATGSGEAFDLFLTLAAAVEHTGYRKVLVGHALATPNLTTERLAAGRAFL